MARGYFEDPLQNFAFALVEASGLDNLGEDFRFVFRSRRARAISGAATYGVSRQELINQGRAPRDSSAESFLGFESISWPSMSHEDYPIDEGNWPFQHNVPKGSIQVGNLVLGRAMFPADCDMYVWFMQAAFGLGGPRRDFLVLRLDRARQTVLRKHRIVGCWPQELKPSDLKADDGSVSIEELTLSVHKVEELAVDASPASQAPQPIDPMGGGGPSNFASFA